MNGSPSLSLAVSTVWGPVGIPAVDCMTVCVVIDVDCMRYSISLDVTHIGPVPEYSDIAPAARATNNFFKDSPTGLPTS